MRFTSIGRVAIVSSPAFSSESPANAHESAGTMVRRALELAPQQFIEPRCGARNRRKRPGTGRVDEEAASADEVDGDRATRIDASSRSVQVDDTHLDMADTILEPAERKREASLRVRMEHFERVRPRTLIDDEINRFLHASPHSKQRSTRIPAIAREFQRPARVHLSLDLSERNDSPQDPSRRHKMIAKDCW